MARKLLRRARQLQPLPTHKIAGLTRDQMLDVCFDHIDEDGSDTLERHELQVSRSSDADAKARRCSTPHSLRAGNAIACPRVRA